MYHHATGIPIARGHGRPCDASPAPRRVSGIVPLRRGGSPSPARASSALSQIATPFPAAKPSAFKTYGGGRPPIHSAASAGLSQTQKSAVGIPCRRINSFAQILDDSNLAAARVGPKTQTPRAARSSAIPAAKGASGPTTTSPTFSRRQKSASAECVSKRAVSANSSAPGFASVIKTRPTDSDSCSAKASACSRPPPPTTTTVSPLIFFK